MKIPGHRVETSASLPENLRSGKNQAAALYIPEVLSK